MVGPQTIWVNYYNVTLYKGIQGGGKYVQFTTQADFGKQICEGKERGPKGQGWKPEGPRAW